MHEMHRYSHARDFPQDHVNDTFQKNIMRPQTWRGEAIEFAFAELQNHRDVLQNACGNIRS
jgi:hypothetical protein